MNQIRGVVKNFSYLSAIQLVNLLVTFATYPFLIRILGKEVFGLVVFAQAIVGYLMVLVSFGFQISATREISVHRDNPAKLNEIFSSILILKGLLFIISLGLLVLITSLVPQAREHKLLFYLSMFTCFYEFIFPSWFFQGIEKMGYSTIITVTTKLTFLVLIFVFIRSKEDYLLVPLFNGIGSVLAGILSTWFAFHLEQIKFSFQPAKRLGFYLKDSSVLFFSNLSTQIYVNANKVIVGFFLGMSEVALYDLAEKVVLAMKLPQTILNQSVFPKISKDRDMGFAKKILIWSAAGQAGLYVLVFVLAPVIVLVLGGHQMSQSTGLLRFLALTVPINAISSYLGVQYLITLGFRREYLRVIVSSVIVYFIICGGLSMFGAITLNGVIAATLATEVFALLIMWLFVTKSRAKWRAVG